MDTSELRREAIEVLDWVKTIYRPGIDAHEQLDRLSRRLKDEAIQFIPVAGPTAARVFRAISAVERASSDIMLLKQSLPAGNQESLHALDNLLEGARSAGGVLDNVVTFEQVSAALSGSYGDDDLGDAVYALTRKLNQLAIDTPNNEPSVPAFR